MVIDFHTHIFPDKIAGATINALSTNASIPPHNDGTLSGLLSQMAECGVDISVNLPVLTKARQFDSVLDFGLDLNQKSYTGPRIIAFAGMHPDILDYEGALHKIKELGFLGIKLHPDYQGTFFDDERYIKILSVAKALDLITVTHAGLDGAFVGQPIKCTPCRVLKVLDALGGYDKLVLAHLGGNELLNEVISSLAGLDIYLDTSYVLPQTSKEALFSLLSRHSEDRILFATDSPWQNQGEQIKIIRSLGLSKDAEDKIFYKNAKGLLKL
jgi:predicted TIM-barrel fold metal-dependent hydrolase